MGAYHLRLACLGMLALACGNTKNDNDNDNGSDEPASATTRASTSSTSSNTSGPNTNGTGGVGPSTSTTIGMGTGGDNTGGENTNDTASSGGNSATGSAGAAGAPGTGGTGGTGGSQEFPIEGPVDIVENCGFTACGGELGGSSWQYTRVCVEEGALFGGLTSLCEAIELGEVTGTVTGTLSFDQTTYTEDVTVSIAASLFIPASCGLASCGLAQALAIAAGLSGTTCADAGAGDCECTAPITITSDTTGDYATSGSELTRDDQIGEYCASQNSLEFTASQQDIELLYELAPW